MKKLFLLILPVIFTLSFFSLDANAHKVKKHKPLVCIPEEERTERQLSNQRTSNFYHRLSKQQQDCAILEIKRLKKEINRLKN